MATGRSPFWGETSGLIFDGILNRAPVSSARLNPNLPQRLEDIINKALEKDRDLRYQHASEIRADLLRMKRQSDSSRDHAWAIGSSDPALPARKTRYLMMAGAAALFAISGVAIWYWNHPFPAPQVREYVQITHDGLQKTVGGTDGARLYFTRYRANSPASLAQIAIAGGEVAPIQTAVVSPAVIDVSPDGASLLVKSFAGARNRHLPSRTFFPTSGAFPFSAARRAVLARG